MQSTTIGCNWLQAQPGLFQRQGTIFIHKVDGDERFPIVAVKPDITAARLNKRDCVDKPLRYLDEAIWQPRERLIKDAVETGRIQSNYYQYADPEAGLRFYFKSWAEYRPDLGEVVVTVDDDPDHWDLSHWQRGYWLNRYKFQIGG